MLNGHALRTGANEVAAMIGPIEQSLDVAIAQKASLLARAIEVRMAARLPISVGHDALSHFVAAINASMEARREVIAGHAAFADMRDEFRIPITDTGSGDGCPDYNASAQLRAVDAA